MYVLLSCQLVFCEQQFEKQSNQSTSLQNTKSNIEKLTHLKELFDRGIITQEEFDAKKKQLLGL